MLRIWRCRKGVSVESDGDEPEFEWLIGDTHPGIPGPLILMADGDEATMIHKAIWQHSFKGAKVQPEGDAVDHPAHYGGADNPYEAIKVIEAWGLGFHDGNAVKYICRQGKKSRESADFQNDRLEDLKKARWYLDRLISQLEAK